MSVGKGEPIWPEADSSFLLLIGFIVLIANNRQQGLLKKYWPVMALCAFLFVYTVLLLIAGVF